MLPLTRCLSFSSMQPTDRRVNSNLWIYYPLYLDEARGHSVYAAGLETTGRVKHSIVRSRPISPESLSLSLRVDVHRLVNSHDCFNPHHLAYCDGEYSRSVDGEAPYTVKAYAARADLDPFITLREVFTQMCHALYTLHRHRVSHGNITIRKFLLRFRDGRLRVILSDFSRSDRPPVPRFRQYARADLCGLRSALTSLLRRHPEDERRIFELFLAEFPSDSTPGRPFHLLLAHPAISSYCRASQHLIQLSNTFQYPRIGPPLLRAANALGGTDFIDWTSRLLFPIDNYEEDHENARRQRLPANLQPNALSDRQTAAYVIHFYRNITEHWDRVLRHFSRVAQHHGSPPEAFTRTWMRCLPQLFHVAWRAAVDPDTTTYFPCLFRFPPTE